MASKQKSRREVIEYVWECINDDRIKDVSYIFCSSRYLFAIHDKGFEILFVSSSDYYETYLIPKEEIISTLTLIGCFEVPKAKIDCDNIMKQINGE